MPEIWSAAAADAAKALERRPVEVAYDEIVAMVGSSIAPDGIRGWRLRPRGGAVELLVDERLLAPGNADRRHVALASGAALYNLRRALARDDHQVVVELSPGPADVLARARAVQAARPADPGRVSGALEASGERLARQVTANGVGALTEAATSEGGVVIPMSSLHAFLLAARDDTADALVACGQALQRVVIEAATRSIGVSLSFTPLSDPPARRGAAGAGAVPQVLVELS